MADALVTGASALVIGMSIVFVALILIMVSLYILKYIGAEKPQKQEIAPAAPKAEVPPVQAPPQADQLELIAVITAAVASSLCVSDDKIVIKSIRKVSSPWNQTAKRENQRGAY